LIPSRKKNVNAAKNPAPDNGAGMDETRAGLKREKGGE
jgi:hypothetical protein